MAFLGTNTLSPGLLARCKDGDAPALERLYREIARPVLSVATNILGDVGEAEDVLHEVYLKAVANLDGWDQRSAFGTWIYRITVNECLTLKRRLKTRIKHLVRLGHEAEGRAVSPRGENAVAVSRFLRDLDERTRTVVVLKYVEDLTFDEIAAVLGEPVGTLKSLASRAMRAPRSDI